ncbi:MAG: hypothetical protein K9M49_02740 [Candidatus Marinimicrobia bacterium]|nr:hypothetical protein [Candidatus Neomarinimicrobiota bacterium]MCF7851134.1 hypothetical protein [Candidatus Neomarinimicrobiota bacterium]MCF7904051.1 hypothetical protein [Candidatus Neomarinimicrobiota bacterium]
MLQCDFGLPTKVVVPSWHITLTIPLVSEDYKLDGLLGGDSANTIRVYGDSVDTNSDGTMDILLPDTLADYPGGLYITLENDLPPITLPEDMFVIPGQDPSDLGVGPIDISSSVPEEVDSGIAVGPVDTILSMSEMGLAMDDIIISDIPDATCTDFFQTRSDTIKFTFGTEPSDLNASQDVSFPGYQRTITARIPSNTNAGTNVDSCGPGSFIVDSAYTHTMDATIIVQASTLPTFREAYALLPDPSALPPNTPIESFESITISTGSIESYINSQMPLTASNTGLKVYTKKANGDTTTLHDHVFTTISEYMETEIDDTLKNSSLDGISVYDSLIFEFGGAINGTSVGDTLLFPQGVDPYFQYSFSMTIDGFTSLQANMQDTTFTVYQEMNTSNTDQSGQSFSVDIVTATFKDNIDHADTNNLNISMQNLMGLDIDTVRIRLHNFYETQADLDAGNYEIITFTLPDSATADTSVVLDGHLISNTTGDNTPIDSLLFETEIQFSSLGGPVSIAYPFPDAMGMDVQVEMTTLRIADLTGLFDIGFEISDQEQPLSLPGLVGGITFGEAILAITLENEFGVAPGLGLFVTGYRDGDSIVVALDPDSVTFESGAAGAPVATEVRISRDYVQRTVDSVTTTVQHFDNQDNIVDLMAMMPSLVSVGGDAQISPDGLSSISAGAEIQGKWRFEIPFLLSVASGGVEFMNSSFTVFDSLDEGTIQQLVGDNGIPDESDMLISSAINTEIYNDIGIGFGLEILVSDLPYFPFYSSLENKMLVSADLDLDGTADTVDLDLDTLIMHPMVKTLKLEIPAGTPDPNSGLVLTGNEGYGRYAYSADFNLNDEIGDSTYGTLKHKQYALLDTIMLARSDTAYIDVPDALTRSNLNAPTVADSLYHLTLSPNNKELWLMLDVSRYGELGWLIEPKDHFIATKFILDETPNPALFSFTAGIDVTAYMEFLLNSEPLFAGAEEDSTE